MEGSAKCMFRRRLRRSGETGTRFSAVSEAAKSVSVPAFPQGCSFPEPETRDPRPETRSLGFTLLEVLIALGILGVGIIGALQMFPNAIRATRAAAERTEAAQAANTELSRIQSMSLPADFAGWVSQVNTLQTLSEAQQMYALYSGIQASIQQTAGLPDTYRVTFTVNMADGRKEVFVTYVTRR